MTNSADLKSAAEIQARFTAAGFLLLLLIFLWRRKEPERKEPGLMSFVSFHTRKRKTSVSHGDNLCQRGAYTLLRLKCKTGLMSDFTVTHKTHLFLYQ